MCGGKWRILFRRRVLKRWYGAESSDGLDLCPWVGVQASRSGYSRRATDTMKPRTSIHRPGANGFQADLTLSRAPHNEIAARPGGSFPQNLDLVSTGPGAPFQLGHFHAIDTYLFSCFTNPEREQPDDEVVDIASSDVRQDLVKCFVWESCVT